jgi:hypothetical protein
MNASHAVAGQMPQFVPANPGEKDSDSYRNHVAHSGAIGGGVRYELGQPARPASEPRPIERMAGR